LKPSPCALQPQLRQAALDGVGERVYRRLGVGRQRGRLAEAGQVEQHQLALVAASRDRTGPQAVRFIPIPASRTSGGPLPSRSCASCIGETCHTGAPAGG
jgi:hypothetical protein